MIKKSTTSIEAALTAHIEALEKRIEALEGGARSQGESLSKRSTLLRRESEAPKAKPKAKAPAADLPAPAPDAPSADEAPEKPVGDRFEIVSVDSRAFERDEENDRCKFSWKIVVQSHASRPLVLSARLEFVDMDSYLVEEDSASGFLLDPGARGKFRGYKWISNEAEYQICGVRAHLSEEVAASEEPDAGVKPEE